MSVNNDSIKRTLLGNEELSQRLAVLKQASELNPQFKNPFIVGGYLRDVVLGEPPADCDVAFVGMSLNQFGVLESVREAEARLGVGPFDGWEFENMAATGVSGDIVADTIGFHSHHTDWLTLLLCSADSDVLIGSPKTAEVLSTRTYDIRYQGLLVWTTVRGRSYHRVLAGVACRGLYLCHKLRLNPTLDAQNHFRQLPALLKALSDEERTSLLAWFRKKTARLLDIQKTLSLYGISLDGF